METVPVRVTHFYNHPALYPFMPQEVFELLEQAFLHDETIARVPKFEYDLMITEFLNSLKN
jgi:hypothetical protein